MSNKIDKHEARTPDALSETLQEGFKWSTQHSQMLGLAVGAFILIGGGYSIWSVLSANKEAELQTAYYKIEKQYLEKKSKFEEGAKATPEAKADAKSEKLVATGDLEKDYGPEIKGFQDFVSNNNSSKAALMAALNLSEIEVNYQKPSEALEALKKVESHASGNDLLSALVMNQMGNLYSETQDCKSAVDKWKKVITNDKAKFLHEEARLRSGLCYETLNDNTKAEEMYTQLMQGQNQDSVISRTAEKYLRLLKLKKSGT